MLAEADFLASISNGRTYLRDVSDQSLRAVFQPEFIEDLRYWVGVDRRLALRCLGLVEAVLRDPAAGIGKPERLRYLGGGVWSRRLTQEHRIVYVVFKDRVEFLQARYHY